LVVAIVCHLFRCHGDPIGTGNQVYGNGETALLGSSAGSLFW
jgi:hypothetical protein